MSVSNKRCVESDCLDLDFNFCCDVRNTVSNEAAALRRIDGSRGQLHAAQ